MYTTHLPREGRQNTLNYIFLSATMNEALIVPVVVKVSLTLPGRRVGVAYSARRPLNVAPPATQTCSHRDRTARSCSRC